VGGKGRRWRRLLDGGSGVEKRGACGGDVISMFFRSLADLVGLQRGEEGEYSWSVMHGGGRVG